MVIHRQQTHNAFGDVDSEVDGRAAALTMNNDPWSMNERIRLGFAADASSLTLSDKQKLYAAYTTTFAYNTLGLMTTKTDPVVSNTVANGFVKTASAVTVWSYDLAGHVATVLDANGNVNKQRWNYGTSTPSVAQEWHADGGTKINGYDVFGNLRSAIETVDPTTQRRTDYSYDKNNQLVRMDRPIRGDGSHAYDTYTYDILGQRLTHRDALGRIEKTYYDPQGQIVKTISAEGRTTTYSYTYQNNIATVGDVVRGGFQKVTTDANGNTLIDKMDTFGRVITHTDLGGHVFQYHYS